ncbi:MAG: hypothetical protein RL398_1774 [Planctomycetota bacterium]
MIVALAAVALSVVAAACCVRRAAVPWLLWPTAIVLALMVYQPRAFGWREHVVAPQFAAVSATDPAVERLLAAAGRAGPHVDDLRVELQSDVPIAAGAAPKEAAPTKRMPAGPLGARGSLSGEPLPFAPHAVAARALAPLQVGRPGLLEVAVPRAAGWMVRLEVFGPSGLLARDEAAADGGVRELAVQPEELGAHRLVVTCEQGAAKEQGAALVELTAPLPVAAPTPTLVVADDDAAAEALRAQGVVVERTAGAPTDWSPYAAVLLAAPLAAAAQQELVRAVEDGLGLLVLEPAFGAPDEPLRALLPLRPAATASRPASGGDGPGEVPTAQPQAEPPSPADEPPSEPPTKTEEREIDKRLVALALVVDRSGSMGSSVHGRTKMQYAKASALRTAEALGAGDEVALVTFGNKDAGRVELPLTDAAEAATVRRGVDKLAHGPEQTHLLSGLRVAGEQLRGSKAVVKHVVVISDGEFNLSESVALRSLAHDLLTRDKVSLSVIAITDSFTSPQFLAEAEAMTRDGGGRFLPLDDAGLVPQLVTGEVTRALASVGRLPNGLGGGEVAATDQPAPPAPVPPTKRDPPPPPRPRELPTPTELTVVAVAESALLGDEPGDGWPALASARAGEAPLDAEVLLVVGEQGWPLLAFANRGLGRVGAFAADLFGPDAAAFRREPGFPGRLAQWVAHTRAPAALAPVALAFGEPRVAPSRPLPAVAEAFAHLLGSEPQLDSAAGAPRQFRQAVSAPLLPGWLPLVLLGLLALTERLAIRYRRSASD